MYIKLSSSFKPKTGNQQYVAQCRSPSRSACILMSLTSLPASRLTSRRNCTVERKLIGQARHIVSFVTAFLISHPTKTFCVKCCPTAPYCNVNAHASLKVITHWKVVFRKWFSKENFVHVRKTFASFILSKAAFSD